MGFYILSVVLLSMIYALIWGAKWTIKNVAFNENPKIQHIIEIAIKVLIWVLGGLFIYVALTTLGILLSPLFTRINAAFSAATSAFFAFLDKLIPYAVLGGIGVALYKNRHPKPLDITNNVAASDVAVELARQRGKELQRFMLAFLFRIISATHTLTNAIPPDDEKGIAIGSANGESFYMEGEVVVYQVEVQISGEITPEVEDKIRDELQEAVPKYITDYPALANPFAKESGYPPVEILTVQKSGQRVIIDAVITTERSLPIITARRKARAERKVTQKTTTPPDITIFK